MKVIIYFFLFLISNQIFGQTIEGYSFDNYQIVNKKQFKKAKINFSSNPDAKFFKTRITQGYNEGKVNFGGYFVIILWGAGAGLEVGRMVDVRDGRIYNIPLGDDTAMDSCYDENDDDDDEKRFKYKANSRLFITRFCSRLEIENTNKYKDQSTYFINIWDDKLKKFKLEKKIDRSEIGRFKD